MNPKSGLDQYPLERLFALREAYEANERKTTGDIDQLNEIKLEIRRKLKANKLQ